MRVLQVHDRLSSLGGADWHLLSIMENLPADVRAAAIFGRQDGSVPHPPQASGGYHFIKKLDKKAPFTAEVNVGKKLFDKIREVNPDVIHVHNIPNPYLMNTLAEAAPAVMTVQDHRFFCPGRGKVRADGTLCGRLFGPECEECFEDVDYFERLLELVAERLNALKKYQALIVLSRYMKEQLIQAGINHEKIHIIPPFVHGLDLSYTPPSRAREILFAGRIVWAKGILDLLDAMMKLPEDVRLVIAGSGTMDEEITSRIHEFGLENRVEFTGWISHRDMGNLYRRCRMLVAPSRWQEPFGMVGLEAAAIGRPVVAYNVGGMNEWLKNGVNGLFVPAGDASELAEAIQRLLDRPEKAAEMGKAGKTVVRENFQRNQLMDRLITLYSSIRA